MYNEPDWSSLTLPELLEKAHGFSKQAYSNTMSTSAFLDRALDRLTPGSELGAEVVALADKAREIYEMILALQSDISKVKGSVDDPSVPLIPTNEERRRGTRRGLTRHSVKVFKSKCYS